MIEQMEEPMTRRFQLLTPALAPVLLTITNAWTADGPKTSNLKLRLNPDTIQDGVPETFEFEVVNTTNYRDLESIFRGPS
jgi:hypothetical protein